MVAINRYKVVLQETMASSQGNLRTIREMQIGSKAGNALPRRHELEGRGFESQRQQEEIILYPFILRVTSGRCSLI